MEAKEEIRSRLNIEDVIGQYVQLKRAGRNFKGLSPFSQEKSPSFMVSPDKHIWHDFSSGKGGDVFAFVMEMEGVDFKGAMELLARKAGVDLSQYRQGNGDGGLGKKKERLSEAMKLATNFYQQVLVHSPVAISYFKKRGLQKQTIADFGMGFSPTNDELYKALVKRGFTERELRDAGLVVTRRGRPSDMFRGRMMVSLADPQGRPVGFTARIINDQPNAPKYINTPQTLLYDKSRHVFALHLAKEAIRLRDFVVITEGQMDAIASHQAGVKNVVATAGTALTEYHLRALSRFTQDVRLSFDADKAGIAATERAIAIASNLGMTLGIVVLGDPEAKDPDELIQKGVELWEQAIGTPKDAVEWLLDIYAAQYDFGTAEGKRKITDRVLGIIRAIEDPVLLEHYLMVVAKRIGSSYEALDKKLNQQPERPGRGPDPASPAKPAAATAPEQAQYQDHLLAMALRHPQLRDSLNKIEAHEFAGETRQAIAAHIKDNAPLLQSDEIHVKLGELELIADTKYAALSDGLYYIASDIAKRTKKEYKQRQLSELGRQFVASSDEQQRAGLNKQMKQLIKEIEELKH